MQFKRIYVEITNICNKNCAFCSKDTKIKKEMSLTDFKRVVDEVKPYTNTIYLHVKGEPLLHSHFKEIIDICNTNNLNVFITTNGSLISKQVEVLNNPIIKRINISLNSYLNNDIDDMLNALDKLNNKIIIFRLWALDNNKLTKLDKDIIAKLEDHYQTKLILDNKNIKIKDNIYLDKADLFDWPSLDNPNYDNKGYCYGLNSHIGILSDGTVIPCCLDSSGVIDLGNIYKEKLSDILDKDRTKNILIGFKNKTLVEELCKHCTYHKRFDK